MFSKRSLVSQMTDLEFKIQDMIDGECGMFEKNIYETYIDKNVGVMDLDTEEHYGTFEDVSVSFNDGDIEIAVQLNMQGIKKWVKIQEIKSTSEKQEALVLLQNKLAKMTFKGVDELTYSDIVYLVSLAAQIKPSDIKSAE